VDVRWRSGGRGPLLFTAAMDPRISEGESRKKLPSNPRRSKPPAAVISAINTR